MTMSGAQCLEVLSYVAMGLGTYFWLWYLTWEYEHYRLGKRSEKWWNTDIRNLVGRRPKDTTNEQDQNHETTEGKDNV